jgi:hypothetical protein
MLPRPPPQKEYIQQKQGRKEGKNWCSSFGLKTHVVHMYKFKKLKETYSRPHQQGGPSPTWSKSRAFPILQGTIQSLPPITEPSAVPNPGRRVPDPGPPRALGRPGTLQASPAPALRWANTQSWTQSHRVRRPGKMRAGR